MKPSARMIRQVVFVYVIAFLLITLRAYAQTPDLPASKNKPAADDKGAVKVEKTHEITPDGKLKPANESTTKDKLKKKGKHVFAIINTSKGKIKVRLFPNEAPKTVANFVGLASGTKEFVDPKSHKKVKRPFYDGLTFHRVIDGFMIQGGDPLGTGTGDPGYKFDDEKPNVHEFSKPGMLAMANAGPNTNGSQFFITVNEQDHLNDKYGHHYTIFGEVVEGMDVVLAISKVKTDTRDKPIDPVVMKTIKIEQE